MKEKISLTCMTKKKYVLAKKRFRGFSYLKLQCTLTPLIGEEYDFLKTLSFERAQKTMEIPTNRTPI